MHLYPTVVSATRFRLTKKITLCTRVCCNSESDDLHNIDEDEHEVPTAKLGNGPSPMALPKHGENSTEQSRYHWPAHESRASADMGNLGLAYPATSQATSQV